MATVTSEKVLGSLAANLHGSVLRPGEPAYEAARRIFNGMIERRPRLIVQALGAGDVMQAVRFARENDLLVTTLPDMRPATPVPKRSRVPMGERSTGGCGR